MHLELLASAFAGENKDDGSDHDQRNRDNHNGHEGFLIHLSFPFCDCDAESGFGVVGKNGRLALFPHKFCAHRTPPRFSLCGDFILLFSILCYSHRMSARAISWAAILLSSIALLAQQNAVSIDVPAGARSILTAKGDGFQIYTCTQTAQGVKWILKAPDAKLLDASGNVIGSHFAGPSWKLSDGGEVQGELIANRPSSDPDSVAWLLLRAKPGTATGSFASVAFIRRTDTHGGAAGTAGCQSDADSGKSERIPYTATYTFYSAQ